MARTKLLAFTVHSWSAWSGLNGGCDMIGASSTVGRTVTSPPPPLLRRRVGALGQHALRLAWNSPCPTETRFVASSRHGDFRRSLGILESIISGDGVSPAEFTLSVHHALIGLMSIARGNRRGHTAVAAGPESFCFGFLEALCCLAETPAEPVLLIHYDAPLPEPFARFDDEPAPAIALVLALTCCDRGDAMALAMEPTAQSTPASTTPHAAGPHAAGPHAAGPHAAGFVDFLANPQAHAFVAVGPRMTWTWSRRAAPG